jgi:flagellar biosynthesis protein FlhG
MYWHKNHKKILNLDKSILKYKTAQILAIASGKGGVGKTSLAVNTGIMLSKMGYKVCLFDADTNLANINIMLKVAPEYTFEHVLRGEKSIGDIVINHSGISLVPGASGITGFSNLEQNKKHKLIQAVSVLEREYDYLLVDTSAGVHDNVLSFIELAHQSVLVISPEPTSLTDAFSLIRILYKKGYKKRFNIVVNSAASELAARKIYKRFSMAVAKYIGCKVAYLGFVAKDEQLAEAICLQSPVTISQPSALSSRCFGRISQTISKLIKQKPKDRGLSLFWKNELSTQIPDFHFQASTVNTRSQYITANQLTKRQLLVGHKQSILDFIDDPYTSMEEINDTMASFIGAYVRRFDSYPVDIEFLQKKYLVDLNKSQECKLENDNMGINKTNNQGVDELLDSIRYASLID